MNIKYLPKIKFKYRCEHCMTDAAFYAEKAASFIVKICHVCGWLLSYNPANYIVLTLIEAVEVWNSYASKILRTST